MEVFRHSVWVKPFLFFSAILCFTVVLVAVLTIETLYRVAFQTARAHLEDIAEIIATREGANPSNLFHHSFATQIQELAKEFQMDISVILGDGSVIAHSTISDDRLNHPPSLEEVTTRLQARGTRFSARREDWQTGFLHVVSPIQIGTDFIGFIQVGSKLADLIAYREVLVRNVTLIGLFGVIFFLGIGFFLSQRLSRSLRLMVTQCQKIGAGNLNLRIHSSRKDEIGILAKTIDEMASTLSEKILEAEEARSRFETLLKLLRDAILLVNRKGQITFMNSSGWFLFHEQKEQTTLPEVINEVVTSTLREQVALERDCILHFENEEKYFQVYTSPVFEVNNRVEEVLLVLRDNTEGTRLDQLRKQYAAGISHELKTPIAAISVLLDALRGSHLELPDEQKDYLFRIERQNQRLLRLVEEILAISKIESGDSRLYFAETDLGGVLRGVLDTFSPLARHREIELRGKLPKDPCFYYFDQQSLEIIMNSLVDNALKHSTKGDRILLACECAPEYVEISVEDTGRGIPAESLPYIFDRFYQVELARAARLGGSGLGLSMVKHFTEAHGGEVTVESQVGQGTTFRLHFGLKSTFMGGGKNGDRSDQAKAPGVKAN